MIICIACWDNEANVSSVNTGMNWFNKHIRIMYGEKYIHKCPDYDFKMLT